MSRWLPVRDGTGNKLSSANHTLSFPVISINAKAKADAVSGRSGNTIGRNSRSARALRSVAAAPAMTARANPARPGRSFAGSMAIGRIQPTENSRAETPPRISRWANGLSVRRPSWRGPGSPSATAVDATARPCTATMNRRAQRRSTSCCSEKSIKTAPAHPRRANYAWHAAISSSSSSAGYRGRRGGRRCRGVAVLAQQKGGQVHIRFLAQLPRPVGRHRRLRLAVQRAHAAAGPALPEIRALERRAAELAVVEGRAVAILAIALIDRLAALRLLGSECQRCRRLVRHAARRRCDDPPAQRMHVDGAHLLSPRRGDVRGENEREVARQQLVVAPRREDIIERGGDLAVGELRPGWHCAGIAAAFGADRSFEPEQNQAHQIVAPALLREQFSDVAGERGKCSGNSLPVLLMAHAAIGAEDAATELLPLESGRRRSLRSCTLARRSRKEHDRGESESDRRCEPPGELPWGHR